MKAQIFYQADKMVFEEIPVPEVTETERAIVNLRNRLNNSTKVQIALGFIELYVIT